MAGVISFFVAFINFSGIFYSMKIAMYFETIHTILQVQNLVIVAISFLVIYAGSIAQTYYSVPQVSEAEPEFLPAIFIYTGIAMIMVAYLGFFSAKSEHKNGLLAYIVCCCFLLANFFVFTFLLKYGS